MSTSHQSASPSASRGWQTFLDELAVEHLLDHRNIVPLDCCARCVCGRDTHEAMGYMARAVRPGRGVPEWHGRGDGPDPLRPIDCPCGRKIEVVWTDAE